MELGLGLGFCEADFYSVSIPSRSVVAADNFFESQAKDLEARIESGWSKILSRPGLQRELLKTARSTCGVYLRVLADAAERMDSEYVKHIFYPLLWENGSETCGALERYVQMTAIVANEVCWLTRADKRLSLVPESAEHYKYHTLYIHRLRSALQEKIALLTPAVKAPVAAVAAPFVPRAVLPPVPRDDAFFLDETETARAILGECLNEQVANQSYAVAADVLGQLPTGGYIRLLADAIERFNDVQVSVLLAPFAGEQAEMTANRIVDYVEKGKYELFHHDWITCAGYMLSTVANAEPQSMAAVRRAQRALAM